MSDETSSYKPLVHGQDLSDEELEQVPRRQRKHSVKRLTVYQCIFTIFVCVAISSVSAWGGIEFQKTQSLTDKTCAKHTTMWSPVLEEVDVNYSTKEFNGSFMHENIYRREGSPEVDEAWEALGVDYRAGVISYEDGLKSGLSPSYVQRAKKYGGGFFVNVEGMHHLHCLNLLRKSLYFNFDRYKKLGHHAFGNDDHILQLHVTHCLDAIRQVLMCNVDTGVLGQVWVNGDEPIAFPDFRTKHTCKNYDRVRQWAEKLQAPPSEKAPLDYLANPKEGDALPDIP